MIFKYGHPPSKVVPLHNSWCRVAQFDRERPRDRRTSKTSPAEPHLNNRLSPTSDQINTRTHTHI